MRWVEVRRRAFPALIACIGQVGVLHVEAEEPASAAMPSDVANGTAAPTSDAPIAPAELGNDELPEAYLRAIDRAVEEHDRGFFQEAREHFRAAHEIYPNARSLRGLGKVEFELRNYGEAVRFLSEAMASNVRPLTPALRMEVEQILERARAYVGEVHIDVQPGTASVSVDGVNVARGPQAALMLQVGDHVLEFHANGRMPERRLVTVRGKDQIRVQVSLASPELTEPSITLTSAERATPSPPRYRRWVIASAGALVAVGAAIGVGVAVRRRNEPREPYGGSTDAVLRGQ